MKLQLKQLEYSRTNYFTIPYLPHVFYAVVLCLLGILIPLNIALVGSDIVSTLRSDPTVDENPWWMPKSWPKALIPRTLPQICQPASITDDTPLRTNSSVPLFKYILRHASVADVGTDPSTRIYPAPYMGNPLQNCEVTTITLNMELPVGTMAYTVSFKRPSFCEHELGVRERSAIGTSAHEVPKPDNYLGAQPRWDYSFRIPDNVTFTSTYQRAANGDLGPDDMINYLAFNVVPAAATIFKASPALEAIPYNSTSPLNVLGVLDAIQADLFKAIWVQNSRYTHDNATKSPTHIIEWAAGTMCISNPNSTELNAVCNGITDTRRIIRWYESEAGQTYDPSFMRGFNVTLSNVFISLRDALMQVQLVFSSGLDLGNVNLASNIYLNKSVFDASIQVDPFFAESLPIVTTMFIGNDQITPQVYWQSCTWGWNCVNTTSWADALRSTPENSPVNNLILPWKPSQDFLSRPSVLGFSYLCPTLQRKPTGSLLISVFVATATMLGVAYSIFETVMPMFERRYVMRKAVLDGAINRNDEDRHEVFPFVNNRTRDSSQTLYDQSPPADLPYKYDGYEYPYSKEYQAVDVGGYSASTQNLHGH